MKRKNLFAVAFLFALIGCTGHKQEELITVDVTANYPQKELILQDFMNVEYIPLETTDEFVLQGKVADISGKRLILTNVRQGEILIFDRITGKGLKKINRQGNGPEEYILPFNVHLNEEETEMYVNDGPSSKIQVYDLEGVYKRTIPYKKGALVTNLLDYDADHFLSQDIYATGNETFASTFFLMSKQDSNRIDIEVPFAKRISPVITKQVGDMIYGSAPKNSFISSYRGNWVLSEPSSDTVYIHQPNANLRPFIVRTPSVQTMTPEVFLFPGFLSDRFYFMQTVKKECDFEKNQEMPTVDLVYDKQERKMYRSIVYNADFDERKEDLSACPINGEVAYSVLLEPSYLLDANEKGQLKGRLKEIAANLKEEDNPVIMLIKPKE